MANTETKTTEPKTSTAPKAENPFAAFASFDPMTMWAQSQQTFTKMMNDSLTRWQAFGDQYAAIEAQVSSHAQNAVSTMAQLAKDAIAYGAQLSAEARKLSVETAKKMGVSA